MFIIDTHSHIYAEEFKNDFKEIENKAKEIGVSKILLPNIDAASIQPLRALHESDKNFYKAMMGLHPTSVDKNWKEQLEIIEKEFIEGDYIAIGEIGIDLYWDKTYLNEQVEVFEKQLWWAKKTEKPVAIHSRNAHSYIIDCIKNVGLENLKGVFHSFGGNEEELDEILELENFFIGINGVVTFKNSSLPQVLKYCPIEKVLLETDAPYLSPVPNRGKRNEPAYLIHIVRKLSEIYGISEEEVSKRTSENAIKLFSIN